MSDKVRHGSKSVFEEGAKPRTTLKKFTHPSLHFRTKRLAPDQLPWRGLFFKSLDQYQSAEQHSRYRQDWRR